MLTLLLIFTTLLPDTAATEAYVQGQYGQGTMLIEGNSRAGFQVGAQSVYDLSPKHRRSVLQLAAESRQSLGGEHRL